MTFSGQDRARLEDGFFQAKVVHSSPQFIAVLRSRFQVRIFVKIRRMGDAQRTYPLVM